MESRVFVVSGSAATMIEKVIRYVLVGIVNSAFAYAVYAGLLFLRVHYRLAVLITLVVGVLFNFKTIGRIVFRSRDNRLIFRFAASYVLVYVIANAGLEISHRVGFSLYAAGVLMMPLGAVVSFLLFNYFVFRGAEQPASPGPALRRLLGPAFPALGRLYRSIFIDLDEVAECFPPLPSGTRILDIGGGDGEILNRVLAQRPDMSVTMIDIASSIGTSLRPEFRKRVTLLPSTSLSEYRAGSREFPDCILLSCVLHHLPVPARPAFFDGLREFAGGRPVEIIVLDVEPGHLRSLLGLLSDRYITGDRHVVPVSRTDVIGLMRSAFPKSLWRETALYERDRPNYCLVFTVQGEKGPAGMTKERRDR